MVEGLARDPEGVNDVEPVVAAVDVEAESTLIRRRLEPDGELEKTMQARCLRE